MPKARDQTKVGPSYNTEKIARDLVGRRIADQLSLHHNSQFSAFYTEVFDRTNQKHNRSSSPFTTLAKYAERKVVSTGAGQPNYWPKTWFGADAYSAIFGTPKHTIKVFVLILFEKISGRIKPLAIRLVPRYKQQFDVKREYRLGNKPISHGIGRKCFHYSLIDTSKHIFTNYAMSIEAILHAQHKGKLCTGPKEESGDL